MTIGHDLTALVITYNEEANLQRTLDALAWVPSIVIIDSGSTDRTLDIARSFPQVVVATRAFDSFAEQCNFGLQHVTSEWVLSLDADYEVSPALIAEIERLQPPNEIAGYAARFVYRIYGRPLRSTLYPRRTVLYRRKRATYCNEGHGHRVMIDGNIGSLAGQIFHDDRKPLSRWIRSQQGYAASEAKYLLSAPQDSLSRVDRIRLLAWPAPILIFIYTLILKGFILDGWPGWLYVLQRTLAEIMIAIEIVDRKLRWSVA